MDTPGHLAAIGIGAIIGAFLFGLYTCVAACVSSWRRRKLQKFSTVPNYGSNGVDGL